MSPQAQAAALLAARPDLADRFLRLAMEPAICAVTDANSAAAAFAPLLRGIDVEKFAVLCLDRHNGVLSAEVLTSGSDRATVVDTRQVFRHALLAGRVGASGVVVAHNHPSGCPTPSDQDVELTRSLIRAGDMIGIPVYDHLIMTDAGHHSMAQHLNCDFSRVARLFSGWTG